jgi:hypothetical protein
VAQASRQESYSQRPAGDIMDVMAITFLLSSRKLAPIHSLSDTHNAMLRTGLWKARPHFVTEDYCMTFSINTNLAALGDV